MVTLAGNRPRIRCRTLRIQKKLPMAIHPPARAPNATFVENRTKPPRVKNNSNPRLPLMMVAKRLSSLIVIIAFADLPAGNYVHVLETGGNSDEQKNIKEPGLRSEPAIKRQAEPDTNGDSQHDGDAHTGHHGKTLEKLAIITGHGKPKVIEA